MKVKFYTLGCKVNQYETEALKKDFTSSGFELTDGLADLYVINTCSVTAKADSGSRKLLAKIKEAYPQAKVAVCGCWVKENKESIEKLGADFIVSQEDKQSLVDIVKGKNPSKDGIWKLNLDKCSNQRAFLKIQDGCDNFCAYCKVPYLRGKSCSRDKNEIIAEAKRLSEKHTEIVLCGINLGLYGKDLTPKNSLVNLLNELLTLSSLGRLRLSSLEPSSINDEVITLFNHPKMCPHLHLPFQSGDDGVLKAMNKKERVEEYRQIVAKLRKQDPDIAISCDLIVGFPDEKESNFKNTLSFIQEIKPMRMHIFTFSPREMTKFSGQKINNKKAVERYGLIKKLADRFSLEYKTKFTGKTLNVVAEENSEGFFSGYSENYIKVKFKMNNNFSKNKIIGQIIPVYIENVITGALSGVAL